MDFLKKYTYWWLFILKNVLLFVVIYFWGINLNFNYSYLNRSWKRNFMHKIDVSKLIFREIPFKNHHHYFSINATGTRDRIFSRILFLFVFIPSLSWLLIEVCVVTPKRTQRVFPKPKNEIVSFWLRQFCPHLIIINISTLIFFNWMWVF